MVLIREFETMLDEICGREYATSRMSTGLYLSLHRPEAAAGKRSS
jgi:hypothetical protein